MKPLFILSAVILFFSCKKQIENLPPAEQPVEKQITFHISAGKDYSTSQYSNLIAQVKLFISSYDSPTSVVLTPIIDTLFDFRPLAMYNQPNFPFNYTKKISGILESKRNIRISYIINYETHQGFFTNPEADGEARPAKKGNVSDTLNVTL